MDINQINYHELAEIINFDRKKKPFYAIKMPVLKYLSKILFYVKFFSIKNIN